MPTSTNHYLHQIIIEVRRGQLFSLADDLSHMINCSTHAMLIFRRILISLAREYQFDEKRGFPEDKDGSGWKALCQFWDLCQIWDSADKEIFSNYIDVVSAIDQFLAKFPSSASHLYWGAMKSAFSRRAEPKNE